MCGSLPVPGRSGPVECCLPLVLVHVADSRLCCLFVHDGDPLVRLGGPEKRVRAGGQHLYGGLVRLGRVPLGRFQPLAGGADPVLNGVPVSVSELLKPPADSVKPGVDILSTAWRWPGLVVHTSQHA